MSPHRFAKIHEDADILFSNIKVYIDEVLIAHASLKAIHKLRIKMRESLYRILIRLQFKQKVIGDVIEFLQCLHTRTWIDVCIDHHTLLRHILMHSCGV